MILKTGTVIADKIRYRMSVEVALLIRLPSTCTNVPVLRSSESIVATDFMHH